MNAQNIVFLCTNIINHYQVPYFKTIITNKIQLSLVVRSALLIWNQFKTFWWRSPNWISNVSVEGGDCVRDVGNSFQTNMTDYPKRLRCIQSLWNNKTSYITKNNTFNFHMSNIFSGLLWATSSFKLLAFFTKWIRMRANANIVSLCMYTKIIPQKFWDLDDILYNSSTQILFDLILKQSA